MMMSINNIESGLKRFKLSKKNVDIVRDEIEKQLFLYKNLKLDPSNVSLLIVSKKSEGVEFIRVFEHNNIPIENLDLSYEKSKSLVSFDDSKVDFVFWVSFFDNGTNISVVKGKLSDMLSLTYKKAKSVTYGITDGKSVVKIDIAQQDVKGAGYEILKNAIAYTFKKETGKTCENLDCMAVTYC